MNHQQMLVRSGLTNREAMDLSDYAKAELRETVAYCSSRKCANAAGEFDQRSCYGTRKLDLRVKVDNCPDCGYALHWRRMPRSKGV